MSTFSTLMTALATLQALNTGYTTDATTRAFVARVNTIALAHDWPFECDNATLPLWYTYKGAAAVLLSPHAACPLRFSESPAFSPRLIARSGKSVKQALQWRLRMFRDMLEPLMDDVAALYASDGRLCSGSPGSGHGGSV